MSKRRSLLLALLSVLCMAMLVAFVGCKPVFVDTEAHEHEYSALWSTDETYHWHQATCKHDWLFADKGAHIWEWHILKAPTHEEDGIAARYCVTCGYFREEEVYSAEWAGPVWDINKDENTATATFTCLNDGYVEELEADVESEVTTDPTCEQEGVRTYTATVTFLNKDYNEQWTKSIDALDHDWSEPEWDWDFEDDGYTLTSVTATFTCLRDIDSDNSQEVDGESEYEDDPATCTETGVRTYTARVYFNGEYYDDTIEVELPAIGHDWKFNSFVWTSTATGYTAQAKYICDNDEEHIDLRDAEVDNGVVTTAPTCTATGIMTYTATYGDESDTNTKVIPAKGHAWTFDSFVWTETDDGFTAQAKYICLNDEEHIDLRGAEVDEGVVTIAATCEEDGEMTYTATYGDESDTNTKVIPATGHEWTFDSFVWTETDDG